MSTGWAAEALRDDEEEEEEVGEDEWEVSRDATMWAIDVSLAMLKAERYNDTTFDDDGNEVEVEKWRSPLLSVLKLILKLWKRSIISAPRDMTGIVLFNTAEEKGAFGTGYSNIWIWQDVLELDAPTIQRLRELIENAEEDHTSLSDMFTPQTGPSAIGRCIQASNYILASRGHSSAHRTINLVTDTPDPWSGLSDDLNPEAERRKAITLANDADEAGIKIIPLLVVHNKDEVFDTEPFLKDLLAKRLALGDKEEVQKFIVGIGKDGQPDWSRFEASGAGKPPPKRAAFSIPFILADGLQIGVNGYNMILEARRPNAIKIDNTGQVAREIKVQTTYVDADAGETLDPKKDIKSFVRFGDKKDPTSKRVVFEDDERDELRTLGMTPGLKLLGFVDPKRFPIQYFVRHAIFIYPYESRYKNSTRLFASLLKGMLKKKRAGLGILMARKNSSPQHVLILPQEEIRNDDDIQVRPPGLNLVQLAYADDIRHPPEKLRQTGTLWAADITDETRHRPDVDVAKRIIAKKLTASGGYDIQAYSNPAIAHHFDVLEALALSQDPPEETEDSTKPRYHLIRKSAGDAIAEFNQLVDENPLSSETAAKRRKGEDGKVIVSKHRRPKDETVEALADDVIVEHAKRNTLDKLKKDQMLAYLASVGAPHKKSSNKPALQENIEDYLRSKDLLD